MQNFLFICTFRVFSKLQNFEGWLISGGNDGNLVLWNWAEAIENSQNVDNPPNTSTEKLAHQKKVLSFLVI